MKARYKIIYNVNDKQYEFEIVIERSYRVSDVELIKALYPECVGHLGRFANIVEVFGGVYGLDVEYIGPV